MKKIKQDNDVEEIYELYSLPVKKYVMSLCHNEDKADDITSIAFLKAIENIDSFKDGKMLTWLCAIAKNTYFDELKKAENKNIILDDDVKNNLESRDILVDDKCISDEEKIILYKNIMKLDGQMKDILYLRIFAGLSFSQIGMIAGKSENWARVMFYRSKTKLKGWIENDEK